MRDVDSWSPMGETLVSKELLFRPTVEGGSAGSSSGRRPQRDNNKRLPKKSLLELAFRLRTEVLYEELNTG